MAETTSSFALPGLKIQATHRAAERGGAEDYANAAVSIRRATSSAFSRLLNAEMRKYPSPSEPNPLPGVITTLSSWSIRSNIAQLVRPAGVPTQM